MSAYCDQCGRLLMADHECPPEERAPGAIDLRNQRRLKEWANKFHTGRGRVLERFSPADDYEHPIWDSPTWMRRAAARYVGLVKLREEICNATKH